MLSSRVAMEGLRRQSFLSSTTSTSSALARLPLPSHSVRRFADVVRPSEPVTRADRMALRAARKERAAQVLQQAKGIEGDAAAAAGSSSSSARGFLSSKYMWYASVGVPSILLVWGFSDSNSPPAKFCRMIGLTGFVESYTQEIAKPSHDKLLPDWSQVSGSNWTLPYLIVVFSNIEIMQPFFAHSRCQMFHTIFLFLTRWF